MANINWVEIPKPVTDTPPGYGEGAWGESPYGSPTVYSSGLGHIDWEEVTN